MGKKNGKAVAPMGAGQPRPSGIEGWLDGAMGWAASFAASSWPGSAFHKMAKALQSAADAFPWKRLSKWMHAYFEPAQAHGKLAAEAKPASTLINLLLAFFTFNAVSFASLLVASSVDPELGIVAAQAEAPWIFDPQFMAYVLVGEPVLNSLSFLFTAFLLLLCARALGGNGKYWRQTHAISFAIGGWQVLSAIFGFFIVAVSAAGIYAAGYSVAGGIVSIAVTAAVLILGAVFLSVSAYGFYSIGRMTMAAHGIGPARALFALAGAVALSLAFSIAFAALISGVI